MRENMEKVNIDNLCPLGKNLLKQELIHSFTRHVANCWTCSKVFYTPELPVSSDDLCPNGITLLAIYMIEPTSKNLHNYEYHLRECWHCQSALSESRTIGECLELLQEA